MTDLILYTRPGCHLCDEALEVCRECGLEPDPVDISGDLELMRRYRDSIPVLKRRDTGAELGWPFGAATLNEFLSAPLPGRD